MRQAVVWFVLGAGLVAALSWLVSGNSVLAEHVRAAAPTDLVTLHWAVEGKHQQLVVLDARHQVMGVYHVTADGLITLKSVRRFQHDLGLRGFNEVRPFADEIRAMVEGRPLGGPPSPGDPRGGHD
jgi:hypothetical protein